MNLYLITYIVGNTTFNFLVVEKNEMQAKEQLKLYLNDENINIKNQFTCREMGVSFSNIKQGVISILDNE